MKHSLNLVTHDFSAALADARPPCLSLYLPTHRHHPENQQDPILFRNLLKQLEQSLHQQYPSVQIRPLLEPFEDLAQDHDFWNHTTNGLAVFGAPGLFQVFGLRRSIPELAMVADSFHTKPLLSFLQSADRYHVLGLNRHEIKLFEGNRDALDEIDLAPGVPSTLTEALGEELTEPQQTVASYGGTGAGSVAMHHGHSDSQAEADIDAERFFRLVDRAVLEFHSKPSGLPLILAALPEHHALFHKLSQNPFLLAEGITIHPDALPLTEFCERAWKTFEPQYHSRLGELADEFAVAKAHGRGLDDLKQVAEAATSGRIETLLIEADRQIPETNPPGAGDLLDTLGELVLKHGGRVVVVPTDQMPSTTGAAATCRF